MPGGEGQQMAGNRWLRARTVSCKTLSLSMVGFATGTKVGAEAEFADLTGIPGILHGFAWLNPDRNAC